MSSAGSTGLHLGSNIIHQRLSGKESMCEYYQCAPEESLQGLLRRRKKGLEGAPIILSFIVESAVEPFTVSHDCCKATWLERSDFREDA